jgi:hypothetical protein
MPAKNEKQRKLMCADLGRKRRGKKTRTGMSEKQLREYCTKDLPGNSPVPVVYIEEAVDVREIFK